MKLFLLNVHRKFLTLTIASMAGSLAIMPAACLAGPNDDYSSSSGIDCSTYQSAKGYADNSNPGPNPGDYELESLNGPLYAHVLGAEPVQRGDRLWYLQHIRIANVKAYFDQYNQKEVRLKEPETFTCWTVYAPQ